MPADTLPPIGCLIPSDPEVYPFDGRGDRTVRVLHVDDDPQITELTATCLERFRDRFAVVTETGVEAGLSRLAAEQIHCVVSDYRMPEQDGLDFLEAVREQYPDLPFILFTGEQSETVARRAIEAGVTDYLDKRPGVERYELLADRIESAVERYRAHRTLRATLAWYRGLVERKLTGACLVQHREFVYVNEPFADAFGYTRRELVGRAPTELVVPGDRSRAERALEEAGGGHEKGRCRFRGRHRDGHTLGVEAQNDAVEVDGDPAVLCLLLDVTDDTTQIRE